MKKTHCVNEPDASSALPVIGITGTNGKTSVCHFIASLLSQANQPCAVIGTLGAGFLDNLQETGYTTPPALQNQALFAGFKKAGARVVAMEVSSHGLDQLRVNEIHFDTAIFTNLSHDHLDYHGDLQKYWATKKRLWTDYNPKFCIANIDDPHGLELIMDPEIKSYKIACTTGSFLPLDIQHCAEIVRVKDLIFSPLGIQALVKTPWGEGILKSSLLGHFNLKNLLLALSAVCSREIPLKTILAGISNLQAPLGRMMCFTGNTAHPLIIVDYAHTPDALKQVLESARLHCKGKLWVVFGCGGERDKAKRPLMCSIAETMADHLILTQDNPRSEDPKLIMADMMKGLKNPQWVHVEYDRREAIQQASSRAKTDDIVVIAGKGHEKFQIIGLEKKPFSDIEIVQRLLGISE